MAEEDLKKFFDEIDTDGSGKIDTAEIKKFFTSMGMVLTEEEFQAKVSRVDTSGDGKISFEEFKATFG